MTQNCPKVKPVCVFLGPQSESLDHLGSLTSCPSINGPFPQSQRHTQIVILKILERIPVVTIFAFLDLEQNSSFLDGHYL